MNISQDSFNKLLTLILMLFFMGMYALSYIQQKPIDWQAIASFIIPVGNHIAQIITSSNLEQKKVETVANIEAAKVQAQSITNGTPISGSH